MKEVKVSLTDLQTVFNAALAADENQLLGKCKDNMVDGNCQICVAMENVQSIIFNAEEEE